MPELKSLLIEDANRVRVVRVNRPQVLNALNAEVLREIREAFLWLDQDQSIGAAILTGATGTKKPSFAAGADIAEMSKMSGFELRAHSRLGQLAFDTIERCSKPIIAAVNGFALGGGLELAMACHLRFASADALMGQPEINLGIIPGFGGTQRLPRLVGRARALEMMLSGDMIKADEAKNCGLIDRVFSPEDLLNAAMLMAQKFADKAPLARALIIDSVVRGSDMNFDDAQRLESDLFGVAGATVDVKEGLSAFIEKRSAHFRGQ